ncbi:LPS export ABC transporter periplasmic protein LptC [Verrucomicrobiales bacterium]|nr:LPS export ABC transporter periplasmic protein LptC [Verrucomicrobiales bacterium]
MATTTAKKIRTLCGVAGLLVVLCLPNSIVSAQDFMDKAAIPRPGDARMKREDEALEARRRSRELAIAATVAEAEGRSLETEEKETAEDENAAVGMTGLDEALPPELAALLPVGSVFEGVRFPQYKNDKLTQIINAEKMARLDSEHLDLIDLVIDVLNDFGEIETKIFMDRAVYDLTEKKLVSRTPATIEQKPKFVMTGNKLTFEGDSQQGTMTGDVRMVMQLGKTSNSGGLFEGQPANAEVEKQ